MVPDVVEEGVYEKVLLLQIGVVVREEDKLGDGFTATTTCCATLLQPLALVIILYVTLMVEVVVLVRISLIGTTALVAPGAGVMFGFATRVQE